MDNIKSFLSKLLENHESKLGQFFGYFLLFLIFGSSITFVLSTTSIGKEFKSAFSAFDSFVMGVFVLEYIARLFVATNKKHFLSSFLNALDLIVLLAFYSHFSNLVFLRGFRVFRIFQLLKIVRYSDLMSAFFRSFRFYRDELRILLVTLVMVLIFASFGIFHIESEINPDFRTIPDALWWAVVTVSTVGYGDVIPITGIGKIVASIVVFMGLATTAIMTALVTKVFIDHFFGKRAHHCEFCKFPYHDHDAKFCKNCGNELDLKKLESAEVHTLAMTPLYSSNKNIKN
jgi:voltage-gated potassium channel